jgi:hypothetical protein
VLIVRLLLGILARRGACPLDTGANQRQVAGLRASRNLSVRPVGLVVLNARRDRYSLTVRLGFGIMESFLDSEAFGQDEQDLLAEESSVQISLCLDSLPVRY